MSKGKGKVESYAEMNFKLLFPIHYMESNYLPFITSFHFFEHLEQFKSFSLNYTKMFFKYSTFVIEVSKS